MDKSNISNKSLSMLLLGVIVVSLMGTLVLLNKVDSGITGYAPTASGIVNLSLTQVLSITTADSNLVNFGACNTNNANLTISSDAVTPNCSGYDTAGEITNISVRNDGNVHVNVTMLPSKVGEAQSGNFLDSPTGGSWIAFRSTNASRNSSFYGGCSTGTVASYTNLSSNTTGVLICTNLTTGLFTSVVVNYRLFIPASVINGVQSNTMTFTATMLI